MRTAAAVFLFSLAAVGWFVFIAPARLENTKTTRTICAITEIVQGAYLWDAEHEKRYGPMPSGGTNSLEMNRTIAKLFKRCDDKDITTGRLVSSDGLFHDGWGRPLMFAPTNGSVYGRLNPELKGMPRSFVVWSAGPNGSNEYGYGDDIFSHQ
jgi:hypothetical protein